MGNLKRSLLLLALLAAPAAHALDFKGLELGKSYTRAQLAEALGPDECESCDSRLYSVPLGVGTADVLVEVDKAGRVAKITGMFETRDYAQVLRLMLVKYGPAHGTRIVLMSNALGATFPNAVTVWTARNGEAMSLMRYIDAEHAGFALETSHAEADEQARLDARSSPP